MADQVITAQKLIDADKDATSLDAFINGADSATVTTRKLRTYPSLAKAVKQVMETGGFEPFATEVLLKASVPTVSKKAAKALDTKKVWLWDGTKWNDTGLSELDVAKDFQFKIASATAFNTKARLQASSLVDDSYALVADDTSEANNGYYQKKSGSWVKIGTVPILNGFKLFKTGDTANTCIVSGIYHVPSSTLGSLENKFPVAGSGGVLTVRNSGTGICHQTYSNLFGTFFRFGSYTAANVADANSYTWGEWNGVRTNGNSDGVLNIRSELDKKLTIQNINNALANANLNTVTTAGTYYQNSTGNIATDFATQGYPIRRGGTLIITNDGATNPVITQTYLTYEAIFVRMFVGASGWGAWYKYYNANSVDAKIMTLEQRVMEVTSNNLISWGSSTLEYLSEGLQAIATKYKLTFRNKGLSGETVNGAGFALGANAVKVKFPSGQINAGSNTVILTQTMSGRKIHKTTPVELSNGVVGNLVYNSTSDTYTLTATNVASTLTGVPDTEFNAIVPSWYNAYNGIIIVNIGKNNVGYNTPASINENTKIFIDYFPKNTKFVVVGQFNNTGASDALINDVDQINSFLKANYGNRYIDQIELLMNENTWTQLGLTKTEDDIYAISKRQLPPSLSRNEGHLSPEMDVILAKAVENKMLQLGYI